MIDIKKAEEEFKEYTNKYDISEGAISRKVFHTFRVEELCKKIAILLEMDQEEVNLAKLIGLLHDIARFEQYTKYKTYDDMISIDHGDLAVEILKENDYLRKYIETDKYDDVILKAIKYHNKYSIPQDLTEKERLFSEIVRDADKLDILYIKVNETLILKKEEIEKQVITKEVLEQFLLGQTINKKYVKNDIDIVIVIIAFIYDLNFKESYKIIKENKYIDRIVDMFEYKDQETKQQIEEIRKIANEYMENK